MKLFIDYKTTDKPWGGINSFFKNFKECIDTFKERIILVKDYKQADIILFGANSRGIKERISINDIKGYGASKALVIHRIDGVRQGDTSFVRATERYVDGYVFQSRQGLSDHVFLMKPSVVIHNGVNPKLFRLRSDTWDRKSILKCLFVSWSDSLDKGFIEFADISKEHEKIECTFIGRWPAEKVNRRNVRVISPKSNSLLPEFYRNNDVLIFPSKLESCSNVVLESLSSGLPIVYYKGSGVDEIIGDKYGIAVHNFSDDFYTELSTRYDNLVNNITKDREKFSMQNIIREYIKFFNSIELR